MLHPKGYQRVSSKLVISSDHRRRSCIPSLIAESLSKMLCAQPKCCPSPQSATPYSAPSAIGLIFTTIRLSFKEVLFRFRVFGFECVLLLVFSRLPSSNLITIGGWRVASHGIHPSPRSCMTGNPVGILISPRNSSSSRSIRSSSLICELAGLLM